MQRPAPSPGAPAPPPSGYRRAPDIGLDLVGLYSLALGEDQARRRALESDVRYFLGINTAIVVVAGAILGIGTTHRLGSFTAVVFAVGAVMAQFGVFTVNRRDGELRAASRQLRALQASAGISHLVAVGAPGPGGRRPAAPLVHRRSVQRRAVLVLLALTVVDVVGLATVLMH